MHKWGDTGIYERNVVIFYNLCQLTISDHQYLNDHQTFHCVQLLHRVLDKTVSSSWWD